MSGSTDGNMSVEVMDLNSKAILLKGDIPLWDALTSQPKLSCYLGFPLDYPDSQTTNANPIIRLGLSFCPTTHFLSFAKRKCFCEEQTPRISRLSGSRNRRSSTFDDGILEEKDIVDRAIVKEAKQNGRLRKRSESVILDEEVAFTFEIDEEIDFGGSTPHIDDPQVLLLDSEEDDPISTDDEGTKSLGRKLAKFVRHRRQSAST